MAMRISVVVITHNWPSALELVLRALAKQTFFPYEVIVTDDGSRKETRDMVFEIARNYPLRLMHVWQKHDGARMSRARNRGIAAARGDYIIFMDGDMIAEPHFIYDHRGFARPGCFVQGSRVLASASASEKMLEEGLFSLSFLTAGIRRRRHTLRVPALSNLYGREHTRSRGIKSCNWGFWRKDLISLNGFNEMMTGWGREDDELALRAFFLGLKRRDLRFAGLAVHLWHPSRKNIGDNPNDIILADTRVRRLTYCQHGLDQHLPEFVERPPDVRKLVTPSTPL